MAYTGRVKQWDLFWADLDPTVGSEQAGSRRPVLVVSNSSFNAHFRIVTVLPLTKLENKQRRVYPFEVVLKDDVVGNGLTSIVLPYQIRTIAKERLLEKIGALEDENVRYEIECRLLDHLGIHFEDD